MSRLPVTTDTSVLRRSCITMGAVVLVLWTLEMVDFLTGNALDRFGIEPRTLASLPEILSAPFLHFGWGHLISNTVPLFVLGLLILISGVRPFLWVTLISIITSGALVWLISPSGTTTLGASGVIFGYLTYLLVRSFYTRSWWQLLIAIVVGLLYGGVLWGILPISYGVSWQAHLGGAVGGLLAARWLHGQRSPVSPANS